MYRMNVGPPIKRCADCIYFKKDKYNFWFDPVFTGKCKINKCTTYINSYCSENYKEK
jgi:hypothetical protein